MKKTYVLDTNVLLQAPNALFAFEDNDVVLPEVVLEELDRFKKEPSELGANARHTARLLDELRTQGRLTDGVPLPGGGNLRIELNHTAVQLPDSWNGNSADNRILKVCRGLQQKGETAYSSPAIPMRGSRATYWAFPCRTSPPSRWQSPGASTAAATRC